MSITDFLNARIAEDEAVARAAYDHDAWELSVDDDGDSWVIARDRTGEGWRVAMAPPAPAIHMVNWDPARVLAECAAKRAIVELHQDAGESQGYTENADYGYIPNCCGTCGTFGEYGEPFPCDTFRTLAAVYADHPEYQAEWRVGA